MGDSKLDEQVVEVFFYSLFMDFDALRERGVHPGQPRRSIVGDMALRIGARATLVPSLDSFAYGVVMTLALASPAGNKSGSAELIGCQVSCPLFGASEKPDAPPPGTRRAFLCPKPSYPQPKYTQHGARDLQAGARFGALS